MRASSYANLFQELMNLDAPSDLKRQMSAILQRSAARDGVATLERTARVEYARHLIGKGEDRVVVCSRIMARFGVSEQTAYRDIAKIS